MAVKDVKAVLQGSLLIIFLILVSVYDIRKRMIPDWLQAAIASLAVLDDSWGTLLGILGALPYLCVACLTDDGIGGGDIKLTAATGLVLGLSGSILASLIGLSFFLLYGTIYRWLCKKKDRISLPLGPFLAVGTVTAYFVR